MIQNLCDAHTHTLFSRHAYSTLEENVRAAAERGLELLASADHFWPACCEPVGGCYSMRDFQYLVNFHAWPRVWHGVRLMRAVEADIVDFEGHLFGWDVPVTTGVDGHLLSEPTTLKDRVFSECDYVVASVHNDDFTKGATTAQLTGIYVRALDDPKVAILGHIGRTGLAFDVDEVLLAARDLGKMVEVNEHSFDNEARDEETFARIRRIVVRCAELGVPVAVNTDAHIATQVGDARRALSLLDELGFPEELVMTRDAATFTAAIARATGAAPVRWDS